MRTKQYLRSPNHVTIDDMIKQTTDDLYWKQANLPRLVNEKRIDGQIARHKIEVSRQILGLLKRMKKDPQGTLFAAQKVSANG